jgi:hypothetical protein
MSKDQKSMKGGMPVIQAFSEDAGDGLVSKLLGNILDLKRSIEKQHSSSSLHWEVWRKQYLFHR